MKIKLNDEFEHPYLGRFIVKKKTVVNDQEPRFNIELNTPLPISKWFGIIIDSYRFAEIGEKFLTKDCRRIARG